jgi:hypothetical protein
VTTHARAASTASEYAGRDADQARPPPLRTNEDNHSEPALQVWLSNV